MTGEGNANEETIEVRTIVPAVAKPVRVCGGSCWASISSARTFILNNDNRFDPFPCDMQVRLIETTEMTISDPIAVAVIAVDTVEDTTVEEEEVVAVVVALEAPEGSTPVLGRL